MVTLCFQQIQLSPNMSFKVFFFSLSEQVTNLLLHLVLPIFRVDVISHISFVSIYKVEHEFSCNNQPRHKYLPEVSNSKIHLV